MQQQKSYAKHEVGTLFLVPTPIGNLGDMTVRAIDTLKDVDLIAAEDTRHTQQLLNQFEIETRQISFHEHNKEVRIPELVERLTQGINVAQVSDAGMPSISDPGQELVAAALAADVPVVPLPGASAGITALVASGLVPQPFTFYGFLPRKNSEQQEALTTLLTHQETMLFYEAPHRLVKTLQNIVKVFGPDRQVVLARELTKRYEEFIRGTAAEVAEWAQTQEVRGEFVVMTAGNSEVVSAQNDDPLAELSPLEAVQALVDEGMKTTAAVKQVAKARDLDRQRLYTEFNNG
ncbi:16S rRNA (cytidine(1402)-2'-O)-methyltransferase [Weissella tructae]|uniref:Ribosomal RNA small subunit methyltransferase I n=2 Tax=Weissella TaxID=46255 RepID=A0A075TWU5_9LACO|nr:MULTISPECIES: 16S rRNA (cytidine(1402)-2'-O)-methyltransferase [Weissella]AIG66044.1 Ribosomal RNA small subunit methyltransferase I [Weissella tructae]AIM63423.1 Ribosomal RNA small subunit methyltransferase I [Weissella ceti]AIM64758.1 Ribosomal RNA small subunit methyltransferase I [Weissella ceti]ELA07415.1 methyltransferase [Weissella ceti NC36]QVV91197.1 16S rRNA (cytidine(1402)-2'-O)-methyltransferase [Weissella tructae]